MSKHLGPPSDGSGREPRQVQVTAYSEIQGCLENTDVVAASLPPGYGKSFIARALQREFGSCDIVTSDNALLKQYLETYPELNPVMGKDWYPSEKEYKESQRKAKSGVPSVFNPLSHYYARQRGLRRPGLLVIDEADSLTDMLTYMSAQVIPIAGTKVPENAKHEGDLIKWCYNRYDRLKLALEVPGAPPTIEREFERIARLKDCLDHGTQHQVFELSKAMVPVNSGKPQKCLRLTPVRVPHSLIKTVTGAQKVVALSGTLTKYDSLQIAAGRSLSYIQKQYLTPPENRPVFYSPVDPDLRKDPETLAAKILEIYTANPVPTLVHVTYGQQGQLAELLGSIRPLVNNTSNKAEVKRRFTQYGGLWLCAGMSVGLDLPYDACRQMIIPNLMYPDRSDLFVQKRAGLGDGAEWYNLKTMSNTVQRLGRGVRAIDDQCVSHILDPNFGRLYRETESEFAKINVIWSKP